MDKFLIIDGNNLLFRAYYALPPLTNFQGEVSNGVFGFCNMLVKAIKEIEPKYIAVAFDSGKKTYRHEMYKEYKANRKEAPKDLISQFPILKNMLDAMNIRHIERSDLEADDIIGCLSRQHTNTENIVFSADKDLLQLINANTVVFQPQKANVDAIVLDEKALYEKYGLTPSQIIDFKALRGDASDNIPGVQGVGDKTATQLIEKYGDLDGVYAHADEIKGKMGERIRECKDIAYMSKHLATIITDKKIDNDINNFTYQFPFNEEVHELFKRYQFNSLLKKPELFREVSAMQCAMQFEENHEVKRVSSLAEFDKLVSKFDEKTLYIDIAETQVNWLEDDVEYVFEANDVVPMDEILKVLKPLLLSNTEKVVFDSKNLKHFLNKFGCGIENVVFDITIARYVTNTSNKYNKTLFEVLDELGLSKSAPVSSMKNLSVELQKKINENSLEKVFYDIEMPLADVLFQMEKEGFKIDLAELHSLDTKYAAELDQITAEIYKHAGCEFNINSPKQLAKVLFEDLKLTSWNNKKQKTEVKYLNEMRDQHPIIDLVLKYRELFKLHKTYIVAYKNLINKDTQKIYTIFNQTLTSTGRLSSSEPNLQNIPVRKEEGKNLRKLFISSFVDGLIVSADYSQIELRLLAAFSGDEHLIKAFNNGEDIHRLTASQIFGVPPCDVTDDLRRQAKAINFGIIYGISDYGLSQNINSTVVLASEYIKRYFARYPRIHSYMQSNVEYCREHGFVKTYFGRIRVIPEINSANRILRQFGERAAMNMPLQGSASDIIKLAMVKVYESIKKQCLKARLILQVHDELILDIPRTELDAVEQILKECMENVVNLAVKLEINTSSGANWYEAK